MPHTICSAASGRREPDQAIGRRTAGCPTDSVVVCGWTGGASSTPPTVVTGGTAEDPIVREGLFGPVVTIERFTGETDAVRTANAADYDPASSVYTRDYGTAVWISAALDHGGARRHRPSPIDGRAFAAAIRHLTRARRRRSSSGRDSAPETQPPMSASSNTVSSPSMSARRRCGGNGARTCSFHSSASRSGSLIARILPRTTGRRVRTAIGNRRQRAPRPGQGVLPAGAARLVRAFATDRSAAWADVR